MQSDYKRNDPKGWCGDPSRGAALGRSSVKDEPRDYSGELVLRRIGIDSQGYDPNGTYFGTGAPLFWCANAEGTIDYVFRAADYDAALATTMREDYPHATHVAPLEASATDIEAMFTAYVECALWSSNDESDDRGGEPLDQNYGWSDIPPETSAAMRADCESFARQNFALVEAEGGDWSQAGHDFWLTRNDHGSGFWDGDWPKTGEALTAAVRAFGRCDIYVGDDGKLYVS